MLLLGVLTGISLAAESGGLAGAWNAALRLAFGWAASLVPLLFGMGGISLVWPLIRPDYRLQYREVAGWLLLFSSTIGFVQLLANDPPPAADAAAGGGYAGFAIASAIVLLFGPGRSAANGLMLLAALLGLALTFGIGPREARRGLVLLFTGTFWSCRIVVRLVRVGARSMLGGAGWLINLLAERRSHRDGEVAASTAMQQPHFRINRPDTEDGRTETGIGVGTSDPVKPAKPARTNRPPEAKVTELPLSTVPEQGGFDAGSVPARQWELPPLSLLEPGVGGEPSEADIRQKVQVIEDTLAGFGIKAPVVEVSVGPVVTQFGLDPGFRERRDRHGNVVRRDRVKVSEITALRDDLALALAARTVRIEAPVPGRAVVGLEIPNATAAVVSLRKVIESASFQKITTRSKLAIALGQDVSGNGVSGDLAKMPHLLIAGATGSGKSVCMNSIIAGFLLHATPEDLRLVLIDPKRVELTSFREVPHLLRSVVVDPEQAVTVLKWVMHEMETRLKRFEAQGVRNIDGYNKVMAATTGKSAMPHIAVLIDELADLMMTAADEVERSVCRLAQLARATGIHLVIATQRPSVDVVTGLIKANFPTRISFAVASQVDSRTILDSAGAEQLLGSGDMLYMPADASKPRRLQGTFVGEDEVRRVVDFWRRQGPPQYISDLEQAAAWSKVEEDRSDPAYERAVEVARQHTRISASLLQRRLGVGYTRAARLVDLMEQRGIVDESHEVIFPPVGEADSRANAASVTSD